MRIDAASSTPCRSASIRPRISTPPARMLRKPERLIQGAMTAKQHMKIAFQGEPGANSHIAIAEAYPDAEPLPCPTFEDALAAISSGEADLGMIPIENSVAGRVADIHHLLPQSGLHIVGEWFLPIRHQLMAPSGAKLDDIKTVESHVHALGQCRRIIRKLGIKPIVSPPTPRAPRAIVAERGDKTCAAIAPRARRRDLRPRYSGRGRRGRDPQHHALRGAGARGRMGRAGHGPAGDHFCFPGAQHSGRALQGDGRLCHQRRQHDQAGKLHGRRQFLRHAVLCRCRRPSGRQESGVRAGGTEILLAEFRIVGVYPAHPFRRRSAMAECSADSSVAKRSRPRLVIEALVAAARRRTLAALAGRRLRRPSSPARTHRPAACRISCAPRGRTPR